MKSGAEHFRRETAVSEMRRKVFSSWTHSTVANSTSSIYTLPRFEMSDRFGFEQRVQGVGKRIVVGVTTRVDLDNRTLLGQGFPVANHPELRDRNDGSAR